MQKCHACGGLLAKVSSPASSLDFEYTVLHVSSQLSTSQLVHVSVFPGRSISVEWIEWIVQIIVDTNCTDWSDLRVEYCVTGPEQYALYIYTKELCPQ